MLRNVRISPKKLNVFVKLLRRQRVDDALFQCDAAPKKAARIAREVIQSAAANAVNNHGMERSLLLIGNAYSGTWRGGERRVHLRWPSSGLAPALRRLPSVHTCSRRAQTHAPTLTSTCTHRHPAPPTNRPITRRRTDRAEVGHSTHQKRVNIHGRGRSGVRHQRHSHLSIYLKEVDGVSEGGRRFTRVLRPLLERRRKYSNP